MQTVHNFTMRFHTYHDEIVGRISFVRDNGETEESAIYTPGELSNIVHLWRMDELLGSFAIGTRLADNATFDMVRK